MSKEKEIAKDVENDAIGGLEIGPVIGTLRSELTRAIEEARGEVLRFDVESIELELEVAVTREAKAELGVKFWVLEAGAGGTAGSARTQRLKLVLKPHLPDGGRDGGPRGGKVEISKTSDERRG